MSEDELLKELKALDNSEGGEQGETVEVWYSLSVMLGVTLPHDGDGQIPGPKTIEGSLQPNG